MHEASALQQYIYSLYFLRNQGGKDSLFLSLFALASRKEMWKDDFEPTLSTFIEQYVIFSPRKRISIFDGIQ